MRIRGLQACAILLAFCCIKAGAQSQGNGPKFETEIIELTPNGFLPSQITRKKPGKYYIFVRNVTRIPTLQLRLDEDKGNRVKELPLTSDKRHWTELLELSPGNYTLTEAGHPGWACHIVIGNQQ